MRCLEHLPDIHPWLHYALDSTMMLMLSFPALYFFVLQPLHRHIKQRQCIEDELRAHRETLARTVEERTRELQNSNSQLQASREDLNRAQAVAHIGSWRLDARSNQLTWSDETYHIFGITPGTPLTYELFLQCVVPEDRSYVDSKWQSALKGLPYDIEHRILAGSTLKWIREKANLEFDCHGKLRGGFGTAQDITELKQAADERERLLAQLSHQRATLDLIMENTRAQLAYLDVNFNFLHLNSAFERGCKRPRQELIGHNIFELFPNPEKEAIFRRVCATGEPAEFFAEPYKHAGQSGGDVTFWDWSLVCMRNAEGQVEGLVLSQMDVTQRERLEQDLKQAQDDLERKVEQRTTELKASLRTLNLEIEARRLAEAENNELLQLERLLTDISTDFASHKRGRFNSVLQNAVSRLMKFLKADAAILAEFVGNTARVAVHCQAPGHPFSSEGLSMEQLPWTLNQLRGQQRVSFADLQELPPQAQIDLGYYQRTNTKSLLAFPLVVSQESIGALVFIATGRQHPWSTETVRRMRIVENLFASQLLRWRSEQALSEAEIRFHAIADFIRDWEYWQSPEGSILFCSPACESITGYRPEQFLVDPALLKNIVLPDDAEVWQKHYCDAFQHPSVHSLEFRIRHANHEVRWIQHYSQPIFDNGQFLGFRVNNRDITEIKETEFETQQLRAELSRMARIATADQLSASLSHELRQPLTAILSNAQAAERFLAQEPPGLEETKEALQDIVADNQRAIEILHHLRALYRKGDFKRSALDLNRLIEETLLLLRNDLILQGVSCRMELDPQLSAVYGNRTELQQIIINLVLNANEAMAEVKADARTLIISSQQEKTGQVKVTVRDSGPGFAPDAAQKLFEPFFTTKESGMGMGLTLCQSFIQAHNGRIWAESNTGGGAAFHFTIPRCQ